MMKFCKLYHRYVSIIMLLLILLTTVLVTPVSVEATTQDYHPIEHLVIVTDCSWFQSELETTLRNEEAEDNGTSLDEYQGSEFRDHKFVSWGASGWVNDIQTYVNQYYNEGVAVVFWMGFDIVDDTTTFTHDVLVQNMLSEYQHELVPHTERQADGTEITTYEDEETSELQYTYSVETETCWTKAAQRYSDEIRNNGLYDYLTNMKVNSYWVGLPPNAVENADGDIVSGYDEEGSYYTSIKNEDGSEKAISALYGYWASKWNEALSAAGRVIDIWDAAGESHLYFSGTVHQVGDGYHGSNTHGGGTGTDSGYWTDADTNHGGEPEETHEAEVGDHEYNASDASHARRNGYNFYSYDEETYQTLFHVIFNQVRLLNPTPEAGETIAQDMYSVSASLTAYVNNVLSPNAGENHSDHLILDTYRVGNAGALLGYGDEDYDFVANIVTKLSSTSSTVSYEALETNSGQLDDALQYARYGRLLNDMGLDKYGVKHTIGSGRIISGGLMLVVYVLSLLCSKLFGIFVDLMVALNPFRFFTNIGGTWGQNLTQAVHDMDANGPMSNTAKNLLSNAGINQVTKLISGMYNALQSWSWGLLIPVGMAVVIAGLFCYLKLFNSRNTERQTRLLTTWLMRLAFIAIGIPLLGCVYSATLEKLDYVTDDTKCASTQLVASTYVDFSAWVQQMRLNPVDGGTFEIEWTNSSYGGDASVATLANLRDTALAINQATGVVDSGVSQISYGDELSWSKSVLSTSANSSETVINQCYDLLTGYMSDNFYYPSDWEAEIGSYIRSLAVSNTITTGRRQGGTEDSFDMDVNQGETTVYNMFDETNETSDWLDRDTADSSLIFKPTGGKWENFNIFNNGVDITTNAVSDSKITYNYSYNGNTTGIQTDAKMGLSTLSMYNYLSSRFTQSGVVMYSNANATNIQTKYSHYAINSVGSGVLGFLYYLNGLVLMMIAAIIGVYYVFSASMNVIKKGFTVLVSIPAASLGVLKSIATIISTVFSMILEIIMMGFLYTLITQLLMVFIDVINGVLTGQYGTSTPVVGGILATWNSSNTLDTLMTSGASLYLNLVVTTGIMMFFGFGLMKYRRAWCRVSSMVVDKVHVALLPDAVLDAMDETQKIWNERKQRVSRIPVRVLAYCKNFVASVADILYNRHVETIT